MSQTRCLRQERGHGAANRGVGDKERLQSGETRRGVGKVKTFGDKTAARQPQGQHCCLRTGTWRREALQVNMEMVSPAGALQVQLQ